MDYQVAERYARATFNAAQKQGIIGPVGDDLQVISDLIQNDSRFAKFLTDPDRGREAKMQLLEKTFSDRVTSLTMQFIRLVMDKHRNDSFVGIADAYARLRKEAEKILSIQVRSARELDADQRSRIEAKISKATGKQIQAEYAVDPKLVGGVAVELEGYVMDGTVAGGLNRMRETLKYDLLKQN